MADVNRGNRPLSPHLQVYRLPLVAKISIMTRITGVALGGAALLVVWWLPKDPAQHHLSVSPRAGDAAVS